MTGKKGVAAKAAKNAGSRHAKAPKPRHSPAHRHGANGAKPAKRPTVTSKPSSAASAGAPRGLPKGLARLAAMGLAAEAEPDVKTASGEVASDKFFGGGQVVAPKGDKAIEEEVDSDLGPVVVKRSAVTAPLLPPEMAPKGSPAPAASPVDLGGATLVGGGHRKVMTDGDGIEVMAKGASKFTSADLEMLKRVIQVKGNAGIIDGFNLDALKYDTDGLVPVIAQDRTTGAVLMQGWANREALEKTLKSKQMTYWNRQRNQLMEKGKDSGGAQTLVKLMPDCDSDSLLAVVEQEGVACHKDTATCWNDARAMPIAGVLGELDRTIQERSRKPMAGNYTNQLLKDPVMAMKKIVEETKEVVQALQGKNASPLEHEAADLLFHLLVACRAKGVGLEKILRELQSRHKEK